MLRDTFVVISCKRSLDTHASWRRKTLGAYLAQLPGCMPTACGGQIHGQLFRKDIIDDHPSPNILTVYLDCMPIIKHFFCHCMISVFSAFVSLGSL